LQLVRPTILSFHLILHLVHATILSFHLILHLVSAPCLAIILLDLLRMGGVAWTR
jgi:hypothetical protein